MDLRVWLLRNELPPSLSLRDAILHIPCSDYRSYSVLKVFAAGYRTGFKLTDGDGQPTEALRVMVSLMEGVTMCQGSALPDNVKRAFGKDESTLANLVDDSWWLQGLTPRLGSAFSAARNYGSRDWVWNFLPGLDGAVVIYKEDGKTRRRRCYIARCQPNWRMNDAVYEGLWRWNYDHTDGTVWRRPAKCPDAYGILERNPTIRTAAGQGDGERPAEGGGAAAAAQLPAPLGSV